MKHLLRPLFLLMALPLLAINVHAQPDDMPRPSPERLQEIKAQKAAYLTTKLALTEQEAQKFWPIYNGYDAAMEDARKAREEMRASRQAQMQLTEEQAAALLDKLLAERQKEIDLERTYYDRFKKSIGALKALELHKAERDFHREVLRRLKERRDDRRGPGGDDPPRRP